MNKQTANLLLTLASIGYPLLWYFGSNRGWAVWLAAAMAVLWALRAVLQQGLQRRIAAALSAFFVCILIFRRPDSLYWYPVWINGMMLAVFGGSLFARQSAIERLARLQTPDLPPSAVVYTRKVTVIWCIFFAANGTTAALLAISGQYGWWALYTGVIAYLLMGILLGGEWLYRKFLLKVET
ncbi:hypothetical protein ACOR62_03665 [Neisseria lisongii]|uniref:Integral membrane protein n=1 Tax=Neisseria lisongii TaxID=2912188 RepID=A0AAW5AD55_9NEIS|nr:hypothetical protein [Neisseria lisongii]MCF7529244.1 hypothetical protein [Neisseria lisongii]